MVATGARALPQMIGAVTVLLSYGIYFWRVLRKSQGNKTIECGAMAIMVMLAIAFLSKFIDLPDRVLALLCVLLVILCFTTLGFFVTGLIRSSQLRTAGRAAKGQSAPKQRAKSS
jgi:hypothetical protein